MEIMGFCIGHSEKATEVVETILDSLTIPETDIPKKLARLFLVSDILHNSNASVKNSSAYRSEFQRNLKEIFKGLNVTYSKIEGRMTADKMKDSVTRVLQVWKLWSLYPVTFLDELEDIFLSRRSEKSIKSSSDTDKNSLNNEILKGNKTVDTINKDQDSFDSDINGEDIDGFPLELDENEDIDGVPIEIGT